MNAQGKSRHLYIQNSTVVFNRLSFINGNITNEYRTVGGSIYTFSSNIILNQCHFLNNIVYSYSEYNNAFGGAICCDDEYCNLKLMNVTMINNNSSAFGGAIFSRGNIQMNHVLFTNNTSVSVRYIIYFVYNICHVHSF